MSGGGERVGEHPGLRRFLLPRPTRGFFLRLAAVVAAALLVFGWLARPFFLYGSSMLPAYPARGLVLGNCLRYRFAPPKRGDVVIIAYFGRRYLLKRVVALPGETIAIRNGVAYIDGRALPEPYLRRRGHWNLAPVRVAPGHLYVIGDNRALPMSEHLFGEVAAERIIGGPWW